MSVSTTDRIVFAIGKRIKKAMGGKTLLLALGMTCLSAYSAETVAHWTFGAYGLTDITGNNAIELENHGVTFADGGAVFEAVFRVS